MDARYATDRLIRIDLKVLKTLARVRTHRLLDVTAVDTDLLSLDLVHVLNLPL